MRPRVDELTGNQGVTTLIEATGVPAALPDALPLVGRYGEVILLGTPRGVFETDLTGVLDYIHLHGHGNVTFKGAHEWRYPVARDPFVKHSLARNSEIALDLMCSGSLQVAPLHTHTLSPYEAEKGYRGLQREKDSYVGVVFRLDDCVTCDRESAGDRPGAPVITRASAGQDCRVCLRQPPRYALL